MLWQARNTAKIRVRAVVTKADGTIEDYGYVVDQVSNPLIAKVKQWYHRFKIQVSRILRSR